MSAAPAGSLLVCVVACLGVRGAGDGCVGVDDQLHRVRDRERLIAHEVVTAPLSVSALWCEPEDAVGVGCERAVRFWLWYDLLASVVRDRSFLRQDLGATRRHLAFGDIVQNHVAVE